MEQFVCNNISVGENGHLLFAGQDTCRLAEKYGTPLYLMDEGRFRFNCRVYSEAFRKHFRPGSLPLFAGKACCFRQLYRILSEEKLGADVVSCGEIATVAAAGFDMSLTFFHGNCKTDADIAYAMEHGVGFFVVDNPEELGAVGRIASEKGIIQKILLRLTPGIDPHTYEEVNTGRVDSKFGSAIPTGQAETITIAALNTPGVALKGFHCHVGSQVFTEDVFERAAEVMLTFMADIRGKTGFAAEMLDLGGGYGVPYVTSDPTLNIGEKIGSVAERIHAVCRELDFPEPLIFMEPGRSLVADAGMTLYTVGSVKTIPGYKAYVAVDGGMTDNPRFALYGARYTVLPADKMNESRTFTADLAGRCCESGDILQKNVSFPASVARGDLEAVCTTGAYNFSMSSVYNRVPRPPVVMLKDGDSYVAVRRETFEDLNLLDQ